MARTLICAQSPALYATQKLASSRADFFISTSTLAHFVCNPVLKGMDAIYRVTCHNGRLQASKFGCDRRLDCFPIGSHQRHLAFADKLVIIERTDAERRAAPSYLLDPARHADGRPWRNRTTMLDANAAPDDNLRVVVDVLLHLLDADRLDDRDEVPGRNALDQRVSVGHAVRQPGEQRPCRLVRGNDVDFGEADLADQFVIHGWRGLEPGARTTKP